MDSYNVEKCDETNIALEHSDVINQEGYLLDEDYNLCLLPNEFGEGISTQIQEEDWKYFKIYDETTQQLNNRKCYNVLMIDPPWKKSKGGLRSCRPNQEKKFDYDTMEIQDIFKLLDKEVFTLAEETNTVFMWCIDKYICEIDKYMFDRGYKKHCIFIWNKENGVAPAFTVRYSHEYLVWYYKPKMIKIAESMRGKFTTVFSEKARQHSRKPEFAYNMISSLYPSCKKIDIFAREKREGWDVWGNETTHFHGKVKA